MSNLEADGNLTGAQAPNSDGNSTSSDGNSTGAQAPNVLTKSLFHSKIFWVNIIALVCLFLQVKFGWVIDESAQMQILAVVNIILRYFTKEGVYIR